MEVILLPDVRALDWLSSHSEGIRIQHNAHREAHRTIERHLLHRERLGERVLLSDHNAKRVCAAKDSLWELSVVRQDGTELHVAGPAIGPCIALVQSMLDASARGSIAA